MQNTPQKPILQRSTNNPIPLSIGERYDEYLETTTLSIICKEESDDNMELDIDTFGLQFVLDTFKLVITRKTLFTRQAYNNTT
jgi:hypothetical protein